jgi:hypothetical protein
MKRLYTTTILSVIASLFVIISNQQICLPDGCFFAPQNQVCSDGNCINEDMSNHLQERSNFLLAVVKDNQQLAQLLTLFFIFIILLNCKRQFLQLNLQFKSIIKNYAFVHNRLINLFAKGVLHPKIY